MRLLVVISTSASALACRLLISHLIAHYTSNASWYTSQTSTWLSLSLQRSWLAGLLAYLLSGHYEIWWIFPVVTVVHFIISWLATKYTNGTNAFLLPFYSQTAHIFTLAGVWLLLVSDINNVFNLFVQLLTNNKFLSVATAYMLCTFPVGMMIGMATKKWQNEISSSTQTSNRTDTLADAGQWIGIAERVLVLSLVLVEQYESIGFLIAAKSLLRFKDGDSKYAEYVLIGTLLSFGISILLGLIVKNIFF